MVLLVCLAAIAVGLALKVASDGTGGDPAPSGGSPEPSTAGPAPSPVPGSGPPPTPEPRVGDAGRPIDPEHPGLTTLRGNWQRNFFGIGPVPERPVVGWKVGPWCGRSEDQGEWSTWCGTGWNGQPNVIPQPDGSTEVRIGGYDFAYHFLDGETGEPTHPEFKTGDLAKGSATSDPYGCELYYAGSRDNEFRIIALDRQRPRELWSMTAKTSAEGGRWNDDWDGAAQIVGDYMLVGGEDSWFRVVRLNRRCEDNGVSVNPKVVFETPGWDEQMIQDLQGNQSTADISIENAVAYDPERKVAYFGNGGGLIQGYDIAGILRGGSNAKLVFRYWMGGENDASIVIADDGDLIASSHYEAPNPHSEATGQLIRLDPSKQGNPVVWRLRDPVPNGQEGGFFSTPALVGRWLYATTNGGRFMGIDALTSEVLWTIRLPGPLWSGPAVVDGTAVLGDCGGTLRAFDVSRHRKQPKQKWQIQLGGCIESTPAIWDGWVYVGTRSGYEYGIRDKRPDSLQRRYEREQAAAVPTGSVATSPTPTPSPTS